MKRINLFSGLLAVGLFVGCNGDGGGGSGGKPGPGPGPGQNPTDLSGIPVPDFAAPLPSGGTGGTGGSGGVAGSGGAGGSAGSGGMGGSGGTGGTGGSGGSDGNGNCKYPAAPYGTKMGETLSPDNKFMCLKPGDTSGTGVMMSTQDFLDCDGSKKMNAVLFDFSGVGCGACEAEADEMESNWTKSWEKLGIVPVTLMLDGDEGKVDVAAKWMKDHNLKHVYVCQAPNQPIFPGGGIPYNVAIDPRTMKVAGIQTGGTPSELESLAMKNQK